MPPNTLVVDGKTIPNKPGWIQLGATLGAHRNTRLGFQLETTGVWEGTLTWNGTGITSLGPRSRRTLRYGEGIPQPYEIPGHQGSDWFDGGLTGMDLCGMESRPHDWDRVHARCPVFGLIDITTGKPRRPASIEMPQGGYSLERRGPTSILPELGETWDTPYNGQHDLRRSRWTQPRDEFGLRDARAVAFDMGLVWSAKAVKQRMAERPKGTGSYWLGREFAFVLIAAVDAGDQPLRDRLCAFAEHAQTSWGNLQISSGGNPAPPDNLNWYSDAEAHYQTVALKHAGLDRAAAKLGNVSVANGRKGKYLKIGTGEGHDAPTDGTAWGAMACEIYPRDEVCRISGLWKVGPDYNGAMSGPYPDTSALKAKLAWWNQRPKTRWVEACL